MIHSSRNALFLSVLLAAPVAAQRSLREVQETFTQRRIELARKGQPTLAQHKELLTSFAKELETFLAKEAQGDDRYNGRLMLADLHLGLGQREAAKAALLALDVEAAPGLLVLAGADLAGRLGLAKERAAWIAKAMERTTEFTQRMALGMRLLTVMQELELGQKVFDEALARATDDEQRATVLWYLADATRQREDVEEEAYLDALRKVAGTYPKTRYGSIAADRLAAKDLEPGKPAIPLALTDSEGKPVTLAEFRGKVLLLDFWASWCEPCLRAAPRLVELHRKHQDQGFAILGISLDQERAAFDAAVREHGLAWRQVYGGEGWQTEAALRYRIEAIPALILIGRDGRIAALNLAAATREDQQALEDAVLKALKAPVPAEPGAGR